MALLDVVCYFNTGFSEGNIPSSPAVLEKAEKKTYPQVWKLQSQGLATVKIKAEWSEISQVDYVKLGTAYYTVDGIEMLNGVAVLKLKQDPINTVGGISQFQILDGWAVRVHPTSDNLFQNIIDEPWTPRQELRMDNPIEMSGGTLTTYGLTFIGSTTDVLNKNQVALQYYDSVEGETSPNALVSVPQTKAIDNETKVRVGSPTTGESWENFDLREQILPAMRVYWYGAPLVKEGVSALRSLGLENTLTACFQAPTYYIHPVYNSDSPTEIDTLEGVVHKFEGTHPYIYGTYQAKNKKVYSMFNTYTIVSIATGDSRIFEARELYSGGTSPDFWVYADPSPNGCPFCQPTFYEGSATRPFQNAIQGAKWLSTPITFDKPSAWLSTYKNYKRESLGNAMQAAKSVAGPLAGVIPGITNGENGMSFTGSLGGLISMPFNALAGAYAAGVQQNRTTFDFQGALALNAPEIKFPRSAEIQGYIGNGFIVYRTHLSEADMIAFDNFLTMYGYANSRRLTQEDLSSRKCFNFVQADNVAISGPKAMWLRDAIAGYFKGGVRLWHELPNLAAMTNNPIKTTTAEVSENVV